MSHLSPLAADGILPISGWGEWRRLWDETKVAELRHSLLHFGFQVDTKSGESMERIIFYLSIADGFDDYMAKFSSVEDERPPHLSSFGRNVESMEKIRRMVARKAFDVLCQNVFKREKRDTGENRFVWWVQRFANPQVFESVLFFFRKGRGGNILNLPDHLEPDHNAEIAKDFLIELTKLGWKSHLYKEHIGEHGVAHFADARPRFVEILCALRRPDLLLSQDYTSGFERFEPIDEASVRKLEEIAMNQELRIPYQNVERKPQTLEEAAASGSRAAIVCLTLKTRAREFERLRRIRELEDERVRLERELQLAKA